MIERIELTPYEQTMLARLGSVNILHYFQGKINEQFLRTRILDIMEANRYLAGRLIRSTEKKNKGEILLQVPYSIAHIDWHLKIYRSENNPFQGQTCGEIRATFQQYLVKCGNDCLDQIGESGVLYRITLFTYVEGFSILTSMSHVIGDGKTFYRLVGMMNEVDGIVTSLCPYRLPHFQSSLESLVSKEMVDCMNSWSLITGYVINYFVYPKTVTHVFRIRQSFIDSQKKSFTASTLSSSYSPSFSSHGFISTNDIIMTVLANDIFDSEFASLTINLRDRVYTGKEDEHNVPVEDRASNLIFPILLGKEDLATATNIRTRINSLSGNNNLSTKSSHSDSSSHDTTSSQSINFPTLWQQLTMNGVYFISNWAGFHEPVRFHNATSLYHIPLTMGGGRNGVHAVIIFRLQDDTMRGTGGGDEVKKGDIGMVVLTTEALMNRIRVHGMIEEEIL